MIAKLILSVVLVSGYALAIERGAEIRLWPNGAPGSEGETGAEVFESAANSKLPKRFTVVHYPSIYVFLAAKEKANGMAVVVAPGAVRTVRSRAAEWGVDPARIGFMGFSAGGEVTALIETRFDAGNAGAGDPVERASSRPDFAAAIYPGFQPGTIMVPKDAPPTFLMCTDEDRSHVVTTVNLYLDLEKQGVPTEMHIYASGPHGVGMRPSHLPVATWPDRLRDWMVDRKMLRE